MHTAPAQAQEVSDKEAVLLGLVAEEPSHAYGLEEKIRERRMTEWTEISFSSIYRVLGRLEERGFIEPRLEHEGQGATRKVHRLTDAGGAALAGAVLARLSDLQPLKNPFQVGLAFAMRAPREEVARCLDGRATAVRAVRAHLVEVLNRHVQPPAGGEGEGRPPLGVRLLFAHLQQHLRAELSFLDEARGVLAEEETP